MRRLSFLIALALVAAACGSSPSSAPFEAPTTTIDSVGGSETTPDAAPTTVAPPTAATPPATAPAPAELPESDYPDVVVADLAGGEVNLRQLALEARPVLLWFWAPH